MFYDSASDLVRVLVVGALSYVWLIAVLRVTGKRTLAQLNAYDFVVTVALGSTLATVLLSSTVSLSEGALALALLAVLQLAAGYLSTRVEPVRRALTSGPALLLRDGELLDDALARHRVTASSVRQAVRSSGGGALEDVAAVVLEPDGGLSVVTRSALGSGSALEDLDLRPTA